MRLDDNVAIVTGGARGIGRGIALRLADEGANIVIVELDEETAKTTAKEVESRGRRALVVVCDVTSSSDVQAMVGKTLSEFGHIDVLVNNAGLGQTVVETVDLDEAEWDRVMAVNITGVFICSKYVAREMIRQESGKIVNISSVNGISAPPLVVAYNASKWAVIGFTKTLAIELAPYKINVNAICPGPVDTDFQRANMAERSAVMGIEESDLRERLRQSIPLQRWTKPEDLGAAAAFLASDDSVHMTGEYLVVSGGLSGVSGVAPRRKSAS
jgi:NAD(P)-dependent dehydrogenase (short-subunit alcohol dehydrogenase family)